MAPVFAEYPDGRHDRAYGSYRQQIFLSRILYLSAIYTFYISTVSVVNLVRYRKLGSPVLSAAKVLNVVAAMMSVLGLQTAMISRFSPTDNAYFARTMNTVTGAAVCFGVIVIAIFMLIKSRKTKSEVFSTYE